MANCARSGRVAVLFDNVERNYAQEGRVSPEPFQKFARVADFREEVVSDVTERSPQVAKIAPYELLHEFVNIFRLNVRFDRDGFQV